MSDLVVIVPTRGRPEIVSEMAEAFTATCTASTKLVFAVHSDDPRLAEYEAALRPFSPSPLVTYAIAAGPAVDMVGALNSVAWAYAHGAVEEAAPFAIAPMGDARRPRTAGWDRAYVDALHDLGAGIVYGDDLVDGEVPPVQVAVTSDIVRALGYMAPPRLRSAYVDSFWLQLGTAAGCLHRLPGIVVEHSPAAGEVDDPAGHAWDRTVFWGWRRWRMPADVVKVRDVVTLVTLAMLERQSEAVGMKRVTMARDQLWTFDLLPEALAELGIDAKAVLHVGAHRGEEVRVYRKCGFGSIVLVEPDPGDVEFLLAEFPDVAVVEQACGAREGVATLHRAGVFAGLAADPNHPASDTVSVSVGPLREVQADHPANVLVVDTQGTELEVLASADLSGVDLVIVETQAVARGLYAAFWPDAVEALSAAGFVPAIRWEHQRHFADTLFVRTPADA